MANPGTAPEPLVLSPLHDPIYLTGAKLMARLSYPDAALKDKRAELEDALCALALQQNARAYREDRTELAVPANLFRFTETQLKHHQKFATKTLKERLISGRIAAAFLRHFEDSKIPEALKGVKRMSLNEVIAFVAETEGYENPANLEQRFWRPSKPVIHIAAALAVVGQEWTRKGEPLSFYHLLLYPDLIEDITERTRIFADMINRVTQFPVSSEDLVPVHIV